MGYGQGYRSLCQVAVENAFRTIATLNTASGMDTLMKTFGSGTGSGTCGGQFVLMTDESIADKRNIFYRDALENAVGMRGKELGNKIVSGGLGCQLAYDLVDTNFTIGQDNLLYAAIGTYARDTGYANFTLADDLSKSLTLAFLRRLGSDVCWEVTSGMVKTMTISGEAGGLLMMALDLLAYDLTRAATANSPANLIADQPDEKPRRIHFADGSFRLASDFGDALASADKVAISSFTVSIDNKLTDAEFPTIENAGHTDGNLTYQPVRNDRREITLEIKLPRYTADTLIAALHSQANYQADFIFTDGTSTLKILFPWLQVVDFAAPISGSGLVEETITFRAFRGTDYNDGAGNTVMLLADASTKVVEELAFETQNQYYGL